MSIIRTALEDFKITYYFYINSSMYELEYCLYLGRKFLSNKTNHEQLLISERVLLRNKIAKQNKKKVAFSKPSEKFIF